MEETLIALERELDALRGEHKTAEREIEDLMRDPNGNVFLIKQKKKYKLLLRDKIAEIEMQLYPDIIA